MKIKRGGTGEKANTHAYVGCVVFDWNVCAFRVGSESGKIAAGAFFRGVLVVWLGVGSGLLCARLSLFCALFVRILRTNNLLCR